MDELEIKIALSYKIPENNLTLNGILRGLQEDQNELMRNIVKAILTAIEKKVIEEYISSHPNKYYRYGRQPRARKLITSFGPIHYKLAQLYDEAAAGQAIHLSFRMAEKEARRIKGWAEAAAGQAIHLSFRMAEKEARRIKGWAPGRSTLQRCVGPWHLKGLEDGLTLLDSGWRRTGN